MLAAGRPYAAALVGTDLPGIDAAEAVCRMWALDEDLQAVLCAGSAAGHADEMVSRLGLSDRLSLVRPPLGASELRLLACGLCVKRDLAGQARLREAEMDA